jgi:Fe-S-cluster containining protein
MATESFVPIETLQASRQTAPGLARLERQVERGSLFAHSAIGENFVRIGEAEVFLHGLIDTLLAKGVVTESEIVSSIGKVRSELTERGEVSGGRTMIRPDTLPAETIAPVQVDCQARLHICHAACCKLAFALSIPEVESGKIKWDLGRPYFIRQENNGCCTHLDAPSGQCHIYQDRPGVCKQYSCANDRRIWTDFEKMELNTEWIEANLKSTAEPHVLRAFMLPADQPAPSVHRNPGSSE